MNRWNEKLERMVDGELPRKEEREVLLHCQETGEWRDLALAYVEQQALRREMSGLLAEEMTSRPSVQVGAEERTTPSAPPTSPKHQDSWGVWSLAAAVLLALGLGYGAGWGIHNKSPQGGQTIPFPNQIVSQDKSQESAASPSSMQWIVNHPNRNELQQIEIPILADESKSSWEEMLRPDYDQELLDEMRSRGLNLHFQRTLTPVRLKSGKRVVVPIEQYYERPFQ